MTPILFLAALLSVADPQGDAIGQGNLTPPTAVVFRAPGIFDAQQISVPEAETFGFELTMGQLPNPWRLANGFSFPIIEVYLSTKSGGQNTLLPGSNMRLPEGQGWHYAFRLTGDRFDVYRATEQGVPAQVTDLLDARLEVVGNTLRVYTNLPLPERYSIYGMVGSYDPFIATGWRTVTDVPNPWAFSSREPSAPVIDVIADSFSMQRAALAQGVLPEIRSAVRQDAWLIAAAVGFAFMLVAAFGQLLLPKRAAKRSLAAVNYALKASSSSTKPTTQPATQASSKAAAQNTQPASSASKTATGRGSRGKPSHNTARGLARQRHASRTTSTAATPDQPVLLGDKLLFAPEVAPEATPEVIPAANTKTLRPPPSNALTPRLSPQAANQASEPATNAVTNAVTEAVVDSPEVTTDSLNEAAADLFTDSVTDSITDSITDVNVDSVADTVADTMTPERSGEAGVSSQAGDTSSLQATQDASQDGNVKQPVKPQRHLPQPASTSTRQTSTRQPSEHQTSERQPSERAQRTPERPTSTRQLSERARPTSERQPSERQSSERSTPSTEPSERTSSPAQFANRTSQMPKRQPSVARGSTQTSALPAKPSPPTATSQTSPKTQNTSTAPHKDLEPSPSTQDTQDLLPAERIRRERLARKAQTWEEGFFDDGWFDWQTSQAVFEEDE